MRIMGIDPGQDGGLAIIHFREILYSREMPLIGGSKKRLIDGGVIARTIQDYKPELVVIEKVGAMPGQGVTSMFTFGYGAGLLEGVCSATQTPFILVHPQTWMKEVLKGLPKGDSKMSTVFCQRMWPGIDWRKSSLAKKMHDGKTDAACLAFYGLLTYAKQDREA